MVLPSATTDIAGRGPSVVKLGTGSKTERKELCSNSNCRCLLLVRPHQDGTPFSPGQGSPPRPHVGHPCDAPRLSAHSPGCLLTPADQAAVTPGCLPCVARRGRLEPTTAAHVRAVRSASQHAQIIKREIRTSCHGRIAFPSSALSVSGSVVSFPEGVLPS